MSPIALKAVYLDIGKPYFIAQSSIDLIALFVISPSESNANDGLTTLRWWTWTVRIRTVAEIPIEIFLVDNSSLPIYQQIANQSLHLKELGLSNRKIAEHLHVDEKTTAKAIAWLLGVKSNSNSTSKS